MRRISIPLVHAREPVSGRCPARDRTFLPAHPEPAETVSCPMGRYFEGLNEAKTRLADFFSILLGLTGPEAFREQLQRSRRSHREHPFWLRSFLIRGALGD